MKHIDAFKAASYPFVMEPVQFSDALRLTQLSESQLREWCGKRGLFQPTVAARGPGRVALYSWQDLISLRVFGEVFSVFGGRASGWAIGIADLRQRLDGQFFPNLWGQAALFASQHSAELVTVRSVSLHAAALVVPLDPHLAHLAEHAATNQFEKQMPLPLLAPMRTVR
ncbi:hypothetical protein EH240_33450 [Mesorhizobium tamadayense]|uniref:MerR family transcriptional regulator n=1 Tax=Mesorhizobium tamadayense TaxID=425306 RepID=A0A3P3EXP1_9HYPH|nr:hypothetical protein [Mesorhizobium tamadayense]RRH90108.1 hypothetical protein EH240_33450 [Mesorhizobium tamadayense]